MPTQTNILKGGTKLNRHYNANENAEEHCGKLSLWNQIIEEMLVNSFGYYNQSNGQNKFLRSVEINCYSKSLPYPDAKYGGQVTYDLGGKSKITCPYVDPGEYWFKAAMSHEFGHAYDFWMRLSNGGDRLQELRNWFQREITIDDVLFNNDNPSYPWKQPDGSIERSWEQFANSWRILFGTVGTRGNVERVVPGFADTTKIAGLKETLQYMPETAAMMLVYGGVVPGSFKVNSNGVTWQMNSGGTIYDIGQVGYNGWWFKAAGTSTWNQWSPAYTRD